MMGENRQPAQNARKAPFGSSFLTAPLLALALCSAASLSTEALAEKVGVAAAVKPDAFTNGQQLKLGKSIFYNERINTDGKGLVQVLLVDGSTFTVGPNSNLVIDKFVYDPKKNQGEIAASFSKGVVRFVGGKISKSPDSVNVKTPSGALAIRGGMFQGSVNGNKTIFSFLYGDQMVLTGTNGKVYRVFQPGYTLDLSGGVPKIRPTLPSDTALIMDQLRGSGTAVAGGSGGNGANNGSTGSGGDGPGDNDQNQRADNNGPDPFQNIETIVTDATSTLINQQIQSQLNQDKPEPPSPPTPPDAPTRTAEYRGFAGGMMYSDVPAQNFNNPVGGASPGDFQIIEYDDGSATARMILRDTLNLDPAVRRYDFSFASQQGYNFVPTSFTAYNNSGQPYAENFAATTNIQVGGQGFCNDCTFMKWGAISAYADFGPAGSPKAYRDRFQPAYWVASNSLTSPVQIDNLRAQHATATYMGDMVGSVYNVNAQNPRYSATGDFTLTWEFANRKGYMDMDFDGRNYFGNMTNPAGTSTFAGPLSNQYEQQAGVASGAFFNSNGRAAGGVMGNFAINDQGYRAGGIFAGTGTPGLNQIPGQ